MSPYVIFNTVTGEITETGFAEALEGLAPEGHKAIRGAGSRTANYVDVQDDHICPKLPNPARPLNPAGKVGEPSRIRLALPGSIVCVRSPGGVIVARMHADEQGDAVYTPAEPGRHQWEVSHDWAFPIVWHLHVTR
jgi:hypothetical protein